MHASTSLPVTVAYACPVSNREIRPSSSTVKLHLVRISPQVSLL